VTNAPCRGEVLPDGYEPIITCALESVKIVGWLRVEYPRVVVGKTKKHVMQWTTNNVLHILRNRLRGIVIRVFALGPLQTELSEVLAQKTVVNLAPE
jgi:hypothetical protein